MDKNRQDLPEDVKQQVLRDMMQSPDAKPRTINEEGTLSSAGFSPTSNLRSDNQTIDCSNDVCDV
jgi:hypothetical protein